MDNKKFGCFIFQLRKEKGWTQQEFADKLFVTDKAVSKWERGLSFPDIELLIPIAELFSISVLELLKGERNNDIDSKNIQCENEIVVETLRKSRLIFHNKFIIPRWMKVILCVIISWVSFYVIDYICVTKYFSEPIFSITTKSNIIQSDNADYVEKKFIGLGYSIYTRGQMENNKYTIHYGEIKIIEIKIKDFYRGVT